MATNYLPLPEYEESKREYEFKILIIGALGTGKTAIIERYVHNYFCPNYKATIGVDFALKIIKIDDDVMVRTQLWDLSGQELFQNMTRVYYKNAVGCIIVFDITRTTTFDEVSKWKSDLDNKVQLLNGNPLPCILLANKVTYDANCDLAKDGLVNNPGQLDKYCRNKGFLKWFPTSAKENLNIDKSVRYLIDEIMNYTIERKPSNQEKSIRIDDPPSPGPRNNDKREDVRAIQQIIERVEHMAMFNKKCDVGAVESIIQSNEQCQSI